MEYEFLYVDDQLLQATWFNAKGQPIKTEESRPGETIYVAIGDGEHWLQQHQFRTGILHGESRTIANRQWGETNFTLAVYATNPQLCDDPIRVVHIWHMGQRHGPWSWQTLSGEVLQRAVYQNDELVEWDGQPIVQQFRDWLEQQGPNDPNLKPFLRDDVLPDWQSYSPRALGLNWKSRNGLRDEVHVMVDAPISLDRRPARFELRTEESLGAAICELAATHGYLFSYRYGVLWLTPQNDAGSVHGDRTGIDRVSFEANSPQAHEWNQPTGVLSFGFPWRLQQALSGALHNSGIELDLQQLPPDPEEPVFYPEVKLSRRNALGYLLYVNGLRCEQQGTKLIISRRYEVPPGEPKPRTKLTPPDDDDPFAPPPK